MPYVQKVSIALTGEQIAALKAAVETGEYATTGRPETPAPALGPGQGQRHSHASGF